MDVLVSNFVWQSGIDTLTLPFGTYYYNSSTKKIYKKDYVNMYCNTKMRIGAVVVNNICCFLEFTII